MVLEAMGTGVPVVTTRVGGTVELITDGKDGFLIAYGDKEGFKKAISRACSMSTSDRVAFARAAEEKISSFRADTVVQELADVISAI
jgi:glycosyltransferase involved in cell wall biosynthesis